MFGDFLSDGSKDSNRQMLLAGKKSLEERKDLITQNKILDLKLHYRAIVRSVQSMKP